MTKIETSQTPSEIATKQDAINQALATYFSSGRRILHGWVAPVRRIDEAVRDAGYVATGRALDGLHNSGWLSGAIDTVVGLMVGQGLQLNADPDAKACGMTSEYRAKWTRHVQRRWRNWSTTPMECDAAGKMTIPEMTVQQCKVFFAHGECLATIEQAQNAPGGTVTAVQLQDPTSLPRHTIRYDADQGVRCNAHGLPIEYVFRIKDANKQFEEERIIPARSDMGRPLVIHVFPGGPGQKRGITPLAPALRVVRQYDQLSDATLTAALIQTIFAATIKSNFPIEHVMEALQVEGEADGEVTETNLGKYLSEASSWYRNSKIDLGEHGRIAQLFPSEEMKFHGAEHPTGTYNEFANHLLREIARCIPCSYETFTGDYSSATYSSVRMATSENWPIILYRRQAVPARFCGQVYDAWLEEEVATGKTPFPGGYANFLHNRGAAVRANWRGPARPTADDAKSAQAQATKLENGLTTFEYECAENGFDHEEVLESLARTKEMVEAAGLSLSWMNGAGTATGTLGNPALKDITPDMIEHVLEEKRIGR